MKKSQISLFLASALVVLSGCTTVPDKPTFVNQALDQAIEDTTQSGAPTPLAAVPDAVQQELMQQTFANAKQTLLMEKRLDIAAVDVDAKAFFAAIVEDSAYSVAVHPDVAGSISLNLKDVTIEEALDVLQDLYGFDIKKTGSVIQVYPSGMRTETIALNYLFLKRYGTSSTQINSGGVSENDPNSGNSNNSSSNNNRNNNNSNNNSFGNNQNTNSGVNIYTSNESDFWQELEDTLTTLVGNEDGRSVIVSPQAGLVTVKALPAEIKAVKTFVNNTQEHLRRQVIIEAFDFQGRAIQHQR